MTRAKFYCSSVRKYKGWGSYPFLYEAAFEAVVGSSPENASFFAATPSGSIKMSTIKDDLFVPGKEYYIDFTEVE